MSRCERVLFYAAISAGALILLIVAVFFYLAYGVEYT